MDAVQVVVAHQERATLRVGDTFLKVDSDQGRLDVEVAAIRLVPVPTPEVLWRKPSVLAIRAVPGKALGRLGNPAAGGGPEAWAAAGAAVRRVHDSPLPPWTGPSLEDMVARLDRECAGLLADDVIPAELVHRNREVAQVALRRWEPAFTHGDLQVEHVFVDGDTVTGIIDWSEASQGDALLDLAVLTLGYPDRLADLISGYDADVDLDVIRGWWSYRSLVAIRWLAAHGFDPASPGCEIDVLKAQM